MGLQMNDDTGRSGYLRLVFKNRSRTILAEQLARAPFHVQRAIYSDALLPHMAYVYMMSTAGGTLGGDSHNIHITMKENSTAHVTTQGASRIYGTHAAKSSQTVNIILEKDSYLEFMPDQTIPYGGSKYSHTINITADQDATLIYSDVLTSGRSAMGESFLYDSYHTKTAVRDNNGHLLLWDAARLEPKEHSIAQYGVMGKYTTMGTAYILAPQARIHKLYHTITPMISYSADTSGGSSMMMHNAGILVRLLGTDASSVLNIIRDIVGAIRMNIWGTPFPQDRRC